MPSRLFSHWAAPRRCQQRPVNGTVVAFTVINCAVVSFRATLTSGVMAQYSAIALIENLDAGGIQTKGLRGRA